MKAKPSRPLTKVIGRRRSVSANCARSVADLSLRRSDAVRPSVSRQPLMLSMPLQRFDCGPARDLKLGVEAASSLARAELSQQAAIEHVASHNEHDSREDSLQRAALFGKAGGEARADRAADDAAADEQERDAPVDQAVESV